MNCPYCLDACCWNSDMEILGPHVEAEYFRHVCKFCDGQGALAASRRLMCPMGNGIEFRRFSGNIPEHRSEIYCLMRDGVEWALKRASVIYVWRLYSMTGKRTNVSYSYDPEYPRRTSDRHMLEPILHIDSISYVPTSDMYWCSAEMLNS